MSTNYRPKTGAEILKLLEQADSELDDTFQDLQKVTLCIIIFLNKQGVPLDKVMDILHDFTEYTGQLYDRKVSDDSYKRDGDKEICLVQTLFHMHRQKGDSIRQYVHHQQH